MSPFDAPVELPSASDWARLEERLRARNQADLAFDPLERRALIALIAHLLYQRPLSRCFQCGVVIHQGQVSCRMHSHTPQALTLYRLLRLAAPDRNP